MRRIAIDTNIYTSFKCNDQSVVDTFRDCDCIGVDLTVIAELFSGFSLGGKEKKKPRRNWKRSSILPGLKYSCMISKRQITML